MGQERPRHITPLHLRQDKFAEFFRQQPETGMGYWVATVYLNDGRTYKQAIVRGGYIIKIRGLSEIPFTEMDIDSFTVTHEKWDWLREDKPG